MSLPGPRVDSPRLAEHARILVPRSLESGGFRTSRAHRLRPYRGRRSLAVRGVRCAVRGARRGGRCDARLLWGCERAAPRGGEPEGPWHSKRKTPDTPVTGGTGRAASKRREDRLSGVGAALPCARGFFGGSR
ncbi:Hypothetical protein CAP_3823 [Chondromyces apiculatus DSM 436]|uniref:Uncharacterized protein n=1 Tax=Chondromyces apiculatus DSM 436 TaxID=1192034 RepID=A0A017T6Z8_9BACT|nr:Hypothetical protein CAP_3823 [Chondromyces apiculatus DSM 436]